MLNKIIESFKNLRNESIQIDQTVSCFGYNLIRINFRLYFKLEVLCYKT